MLESLSDIGQFGNARGIRNLFDKAVMNQANRLVRLKNINNSDLTTIIASDLPAADSLGLKLQKNIGFSVAEG